ncbi:MAG: aldehyde dehydrogenase family protein [Acidimicrobiales bacterium]
MQVVNPATGAPIGAVDEMDPGDVEAVYERARAAQAAWADRPIGDRIEVVRRLRAAVVDRLDALAADLTAETGKPISQARNELNGLLPRLDFFCDHAAATLADETVLAEDGLREVIAHEPLGVVANISAWNYPYFVGSNVFVPALLAGNAVLYKPSELASLTGRNIADLVWSAGVPEDVFGLLIGGGEVGAALLRTGIDGVFFTGSHPTGQRIAVEVAPSLAVVQLELGGKDPVYVADDVDPVLAAESLADGAFYNTGQSCCSVERLYVHERVHDAFLEHFVHTVEHFVVGDPRDEATYIGPVTRPQQLAVLEAQVDDAVAKGATVRTGGHRLDRPGSWFAPTVIAGATNGMAVMRDESFGPIIGIASVAEDDEALALMNDTEYGLTAGVYSADEDRARSILRRVDAGSAYWNCCDRVSPRLPWSGRGHSGIGSTLSTSGITAFTRPKAWHLRSS